MDRKEAVTTLTTGRETGRAGGFTLLELILVMLIVAVVMAMVAPSLGLFVSARPVTDAAVRVVALADYARTQAIAQGRAYRLNIDEAQGTVWITAQEEDGFQRIQTEFGRDFRFPEGTRAQWLTPPAIVADTAVPGLLMPWQAAPAGTENGPSVTAVIFFPDGRCQSCRLRLTDHRGNVVDVECAGPAERFRVISPGEGD